MSDWDKLALLLRDKEYRETYADEFLNTTIGQQLAVLRDQRGLTQAQLAERIGTKQSGISRLERDGYGKWSLATLKKVAYALDCRLKVSFETFGSMVDEVAALSVENLQRPALSDDRRLFPDTAREALLTIPGPVGEMRRKLVPWLRDAQAPLERLAEWLDGYDLPSVGGNVSPWRMLRDAVVGVEELEQLLKQRIAAALRHNYLNEPPNATDPALCASNLLELAAALPDPERFEARLHRAWEQRAALPIPGSAAPPPGHLLFRAMRVNQTLEGRFTAVWKLCMAQRNRVDEMPDFVGQGMLGLASLGAPVNAPVVSSAIQKTHWPDLRGAEAVGIWEGGFRYLFAHLPNTAPQQMITEVWREEAWGPWPMQGLASSLGAGDQFVAFFKKAHSVSSRFE